MTPKVAARACVITAADAPLWGSATQARRWWLVESSGAWGAKAVIQSATHWIRDWGQRSGVAGRVVLIRSAGSHRSSSSDSRRVFTFSPGDSDVRVRTVNSTTDLTGHDLESKPTGTSWQTSQDHPRFLLCTNGKRDACCALLGRSLIDAWQVNDTLDSHVWESTHLGGHRFAPTGLSVPTGYLLGRIPSSTTHPPDPDAPLDLANCRGRSDLSGPEQVADLTVREKLGLFNPTDIGRVMTVDQDTAHVTVVVTQSTGASWQVLLENKGLPPAKKSCGKADERGNYWLAGDVLPVPSAT
ncbi:MAG: sucrase ferredoxin [Candidatus Nanopelagicales bacterium]|jgi:hypothetical protein|nr:hypothetical protein [Candidatus Nanopelagicales bacterium]MDP4825010.1 hypothetical protein [Candidatus Nanopelagicales bacterium]MDP4887756.1 hypothetical protein [Candidatus Nanopelagicales bacterium]